MAAGAPLPFDPTSGSLDEKVKVAVDRSKMKDPAEVPSHLKPCVLVACGSYSPITVMHTRIFETARDYFHSSQDIHKIEIIGGFVSPVHPAYGKKGLAPAQDRVDMVKAALDSSDWVACDEWEVKQNEWTRTRLSLERMYNELNKENGGREIGVLLLCGADILDSMITPGVWTEPDLHLLLSRGVACITRSGTDPQKLIQENDLLYQYRNNIFLMREWVENSVSSTAVRRAVKRGQSIKYLVADGVLDIIKKRKLWKE